MIVHKGKTYKEVTDDSAEIGDLIHVTDVSVEKCDLWCFATDDDSRQPYVDIEIPGAYDCLDIYDDSFTRYREIEQESDHEVLNEHNVKDGDYFIVCNGFNYDNVSEGDLVRYLEGVIDQKNERLVTVIVFRTEISYTIPYEFLRRATEVEIAEARNKQKEINVKLDAIKALDKQLFSTSDKSHDLKTRVDNLYKDMSALLIAKNENYGDSFAKQFAKYGMISVDMRLNDKMLRLEQLVQGERDKVGESVEDTLKDIIGYATLALVELERGCKQ